jgi:N-acyl-D-aspartate/D-glutamate deacylase
MEERRQFRCDCSQSISRIIWASIAVLLFFLASASLFDAKAQTRTFDILIRGGRIIDGSGKPAFEADVGIKDGRIAAIGKLDDVSGARVIDARGLTVTPGFIDLHTHSDVTVLQDGAAESMVRQGVTVNVIGEGDSVAPRDGKIQPDPGRPWTTFTGYFEELSRRGVAINMASFVASEQIRRAVMGYDPRPATPAELEAMKKLVARSMTEGALGMVARFDTGGPRFADEIIELAKVTAAHGGIYATHSGRQGSQQEKEYAFAIRVAEEARIPVHIYHLKIIGRENWGTIGKYLDQVEAARSRGLDVTANQYPYTAMHHGWNAFFPVWAQERGPDQFLAFLKDPAARERIKKDVEFALLSDEHGGWEGIMLGSAEGPSARYAGMRLVDIAKARGDADPADTAISLMAEEKGRISGVFHNQLEDDLRRALTKPWISVSSDGAAVNLTEPRNSHPRAYGSNVRVLGLYARDLKLLPLEEAVRKMTSLPASIAKLKDRGLLRENYAADVVLFDAARVRDLATYEKPAAYPEGVPYVIVNGVVVIDKGQPTGARPGRPLLGPGAGQSGPG